jgi:hypothetical protein
MIRRTTIIMLALAPLTVGGAGAAPDFASFQVQPFPVAHRDGPVTHCALQNEELNDPPTSKPANPTVRGIAAAARKIGDVIFVEGLTCA